LLEQSGLTEKQKNYVRIIGAGVSQLDELINSLLELTRIETGKVTFTSQDVVSISEIVKNVLERVKPTAEAKNQTIVDGVLEGIEVEGDKQKITAIFDNLISNAINYTGENGRIDIMVEDREEEVIRVCITDTGVGIPEEHLPKIFDRYYVADRKRGFGLGLAIVKGYVELHGGKVWVTSELGKGSKFCFTLPKRQRQIA
jgi:signal transduction histidine kinase